jgi:hypothetical protein
MVSLRLYKIFESQVNQIEKTALKILTRAEDIPDG